MIIQEFMFRARCNICRLETDKSFARTVEIDDYAESLGREVERPVAVGVLSPKHLCSNCRRSDDSR